MKAIAGALFALCSILSVASAQRFDGGGDEARRRALEMRDGYVTRGAEAIDHGGADLDGRPAAQGIAVHNRGSDVVFVAACEDHCSALSMDLTAEGLPPVRAQSSAEHPQILELHVPANFVSALADWRVRVSVRCRGGVGDCDYSWWMLATSPAPPLEERGGPRLLTDAEWDAGVGLPDGVRVVWAVRPGPERMFALYPLGALRREVEGRAALQCIVIDGGALHCRAEREEPAGEGFAEAALRYAMLLRVNALDSAGQPIAGRRVHVPIRFFLTS